MDEVRALIEQVALAPFEGPRKVFIIAEADKMLPAGANALLKTLEEPPKDTVRRCALMKPKRAQSEESRAACAVPP